MYISRNCAKSQQIWETYFRDVLSCLSFDSSHFRNWQCHISRLYVLKSSVPVPPEDVAYDIGARESRDVSRGVFKPELKLLDNPENDKSIDKEGVMLEVLYMLLDDIPGVVGFIGKGFVREQ
jgi:hypothetical protein